MLETKTIDSFVATVLELFWSHGGAWVTRAKKQGKGLTLEPAISGHDIDRGCVAALERLRRWFADGLVRPHSTVDPRHATVSDSPHDWLFAHHWHSTLVDTVTYEPAEDEFGDASEDEPRGMPSRLHTRDIRVCQFQFLRTRREHRRLPAVNGALAVESGCENESLGHRVIENLLSADKVIRRAVDGGGMPVFQEFYEEFGDSLCRGTNKTFNWMLSLLDNDQFDRNLRIIAS